MMTRARGAGLGLGNAECGVRLFSCQQWQLASSRGPVAAAPGTHMVMSSHHCHNHTGRVSPVTSVVIRVGTSVCGAQCASHDLQFTHYQFIKCVTQESCCCEPVPGWSCPVPMQHGRSLG